MFSDSSSDFLQSEKTVKFSAEFFRKKLKVKANNNLIQNQKKSLHKQSTDVSEGET